MNPLATRIATDAGPDAWARLLGLAGLLPFAAAALLAWWPQALPWQGLDARMALLAYGAVILSFLGGIHWGLVMRAALPASGRLLWGVTPSLLAWLALLLPPAPGLWLLAVALLLCFVVDRALYRAAGLERWLPLRLQLSAGAVAACVAGALAG